jgi:transcriptional regulator with XRE-family HTH domain
MTLREVLERYGVSQHDLVQRLQVKRQYAHMLWTGQRRLGARLGKRISDEFGISLEELLRAEPDRPGMAPPRRRGRPRKQPPDTTQQANTSAMLDGIARAIAKDDGRCLFPMTMSGFSAERVIEAVNMELPPMLA